MLQLTVTRPKEKVTPRSLDRLRGIGHKVDRRGILSGGDQKESERAGGRGASGRKNIIEVEKEGFFKGRFAVQRP